MMHDGGWGFMGGWMWLFWLLVLVGIVVLVVWAVGAARRTGGGGAEPPAPRQTPEEVLRERYARGEIDDTEYRRRLDELRR